jgi:hypothetical protein
VEAAGQHLHLFRDGLDYAFIRLSHDRAPERGVLSESSCDPNPSAGSSASLSLSMSLYRAREVGLPAPLGVATSLTLRDRGFTE